MQVLAPTGRNPCVLPPSAEGFLPLAPGLQPISYRHEKAVNCFDALRVQSIKLIIKEEFEIEVTNSSSRNGCCLSFAGRMRRSFCGSGWRSGCQQQAVFADVGQLHTTADDHQCQGTAGLFLSMP